MIARGDAIGGAALADTGRRTLASEWQGPALPLPAPPGLPVRGQPRRHRPRR